MAKKNIRGARRVINRMFPVEVTLGLVDPNQISYSIPPKTLIRLDIVEVAYSRSIATYLWNFKEVKGYVSVGFKVARTSKSEMYRKARRVK